jgi:HAD superfamily hydrolase (TIGR01509 family)
MKDANNIVTRPSNVTNTAAVLPFEAVIFDMDGTLISSTEADFLAWKWLFGDYNCPFTFQEYLPLVGVRSADVLKARLGLKGDALRDALARKMDYYAEIVARNGIQVMPYAYHFLEQVSRYPVKTALATSARREKMQLIMEKTGLMPFFDVIITGEDARRSKPAPDIYLVTARLLRVKPSKCLVIEDAIHGITAARNAHMKCIAIASTHPAGVLKEADLVVDSFAGADFAEWCSKLGNCE